MKYKIKTVILCKVHWAKGSRRYDKQDDINKQKQKDSPNRSIEKNGLGLESPDQVILFNWLNYSLNKLEIGIYRKGDKGVIGEVSSWSTKNW